jgi:hypothetical protein
MGVGIESLRLRLDIIGTRDGELLFGVRLNMFWVERYTEACEGRLGWRILGYMGWNRGDGILHIYITFDRVTRCFYL